MVSEPSPVLTTTNTIEKHKDEDFDTNMMKERLRKNSKTLQNSPQNTYYSTGKDIKWDFKLAKNWKLSDLNSLRDNKRVGLPFLKVFKLTIIF